MVLTLLVIFLGMIKIEAESLYPGDDVSFNIMMVISATTIMLLLLVVLRAILSLQLMLDQRRVYTKNEDRDDCRASLWKLLKEK